MKKSTKGAFAAFAAGSLLLGGTGSLAFWSATQNVTGQTINSGLLELSQPDCDATPDGASINAQRWTLNGTVTEFTNQEIVPGDEITKTCYMELSMEGANIAADLALANPSYTGGALLSGELDAAAAFTVDGTTYNGTNFPDGIEGADVYEILAEVTVTFTGADATNASQDLSTALNNLTLTATQAQ